MKAVAIIQARVGSTRLAGKVLLKLSGSTVLEHVIKRVQKAKTIENVIIATTVRTEVLRIVNMASKNRISVYCGSEFDVLDRYYQAARVFDLKHIVRITADCPVIDPKVIDDTVRFYFKAKADYCSNTLRETFPDGQDVEVFSFQALSHAWQKAKLISEREHVTPFIRKHEAKFKIVSYENKVNLSDKRWTLDEKEDYQFLKILFANLYKKNHFFGMKEILDFLAKHPQLETINNMIIRNQGYLKSLNKNRKG